MSEQLALPTVEDAGHWDAILEAIRDIVRARGANEVINALDISPSELSHCLAERNRYALKLRHLPVFLRLRHNDDLPRAIARAAGLELAPVKPLTAEQRLERLEAELSRAGAAGQAIRDAAYGRGR